MGASIRMLAFVQEITALENWSDDRGNRIEVPEGVEFRGAYLIRFRGSGNVLRVGRRAHLSRLHVSFDCDNGTAVIGPGKGDLALTVRVGQDSTVKVGRGTTSTEVVGMSATEGTRIVVGKDVMFASKVQVRTDDGHPIFDVRTGKRVNVSRDIHIGNHVWVGWGCAVLGGSRIGDGSVLGIGAVLKGSIPNNVVAVGVPARVTRRDVAWERPHLSLAEPFYKPDASTVTRTEEYWNLTEDPAADTNAESLPTVAGARVGVGRRVLRALGRR